MRRYLVCALAILLSAGVVGASTLVKFSNGAGTVQVPLNASENTVFIELPSHSVVQEARLGITVMPVESETTVNLTVGGSTVWERLAEGQVQEDLELEPGLLNGVIEGCSNRTCPIGLTLSSSSAAILILSHLDVEYQQSDLTLERLEVSVTSASVGEVLLIRAVVSNNNVSEMRDVEVEFYKNAISARNLISLYNIPAMAGGATQSVNTFLSVDLELNKIICILDRRGNLEEGDESNNIQSVDIEIIGGQQDSGLSPIGPDVAENLPGNPVRQPHLAPIDPFPLLLFFAGLFLTIVVATLLISRSIVKRKSFVLPRDIYDARKESIYSIKRMLSPRDKETIYTTFQTPYEFLVYKESKGGATKFAQKLISEYNIPKDYAEAAALAKKTGSTLLVDSKQIWVKKAMEDLGVKSRAIV